MSPKVKRISLLVIRLVVGFVFLLSGLGKLFDSGYVNYDLIRLLSEEFFWIIEYAALIMVSISIIELLLSILLFWGKWLTTAFSVAMVMLIGFSSVLGYYYLQGMNVENCGCFGAFGFGSGLEFTLIRNFVMIVLILSGLIIHDGKSQ